MIFNSMIFGAGGLTYESGTYTPTQHETRPTISFSDTHSTPPFLVMMALDEGSSSTESRPYSLHVWSYVDVITANSVGYPGAYSYTAPQPLAAFVSGGYCRENSTHGQWSTLNLDTSIRVQNGPSVSTDTSNAYSRYFVTETGFRPSCTNSYTSQVAAGANYTWYAIWKE